MTLAHYSVREHMQNHRDAGRAGVLSKVPQVTFAFWLIKICATTLGETGGDALSMTLKLGYALSTAVFFTILLVAGNTMAQAVRERVSELGVMKAIGFTDAQVLMLVLAESCMIAIVGGAIGLALAIFFISFGDPTHGALPIFFLPPRDLAIGAICVILLGLASGLLPGIQAMRLNTVEALRRE